jgi:hypothetical protein
MNFSPTFFRFLAAFAIVAGVVGAKRIVVDSFAEDELYRKDFVQEYLLAKAVVDGEYLYPDVPVLMAKYFDPPHSVPWDHPTPHTPVAAVLSVPIGFFPYGVAVSIWIILELGCLAYAIELLARWWSEPVSRLQKTVLFLMCLGFGPVIHELYYGQFSLVLLVLVLHAWLALRRNRDVEGGLWLGLAIALKLTAWPVGLFLLLRGRCRAVIAAGAVVLGLNAVAGTIVGWQAAADYYLKVGPLITKLYHQHFDNYSLWTIGGRIFAPEPGVIIPNRLIAMTLWPSAPLDRFVSLAIPCLAFLAAMTLAWRCRQFDSAFGILLCASLPLNPVAWDHYLLLTAIPIAVAARRLKDAGFPKGVTTVALVALAITVFPNPFYLVWSARLFAYATPSGVKAIPFAAGLVAYMPLLALAAWIVILWRTDGAVAPDPSPGGPLPGGTP